MRWSAVLWASVAVALAGCAHSVSGAAVFNPAEPIRPLRAADTGQVLLSVTQVSDIIGSRLQVDADRTRPVAGASAAPACSALDAVGMSAFVGDDWAGIRVLLFTDGDRHDRVVSEAVAVYPDADSAAAAFSAGTAGIRTCDGQQALSTGSEAAWKFSVGADSADTVRWTKQQIAIPMTWICHGEARLRNNAVLQAMACQGDDGGRTLVTTLTDRMSASVWELSGR
ncbi:MAG: sensor domain-containing protein [Mycobacterium sp.]|nr:sensor domain-containing protein [Mycobacterium sp.]